MAEERSANEKLNIGVVGTANQARFSIDNLKGENIVALCDIDDILLGKASTDFPQAKTYNDFRKLLEQPDLDAVAICTPDHIHAPATVMALRLGKHVYCEKPLTHTVAEARLVAQEAAKAKKATQMGTQIHAGDNYRRVVEMIQSGAIGRVAEVHSWAGGGFGGMRSAQRYAAGAVGTCIGICGSGPPPSGRTTRPMCLSNGGLVGFWRRQSWPTWVAITWICPSGHSGPAPSDERRGPGPAGPTRDVSAGARSPLRVSGPRRAAGGQTDLVQRRADSEMRFTAWRWAVPAVRWGRRAICSWGTRE